MKRTFTLLTSAVLTFGPVSPAFAYQAHNWPGIASNQAVHTQSATTAPEVRQQLAADATLSLSRAEFTKQLIRTLYTKEDMNGCFSRIVYKDHPGYTLLFWDVQRTDDAALEICMGMHLGVINGYRDGNFRPNQAITFAEASKMISRLYAFTPYPLNEPVWYRAYIEEITKRGAQPEGIDAPADGITAQQLSWMLNQLGSNKRMNQAAGEGAVIFTKHAEKPLSRR